MSYLRVIPRDLFNEASLLKCLGRLWILIDVGDRRAVLEQTSDGAFDVQQDPADGSIYVANLRFTVAGRSYRLTRPLNSRRSWPLYATPDDGDDGNPVDLFDEDGDLTDEAEDLIYGKEGEET